MSHLPERKEKDCLNCGAVVAGRFCHICGQENIEPKENFWQLVTHFVYDITHFDGKFFSTLRYLLFRPGFLSHEYLRGRRADYLHPIRMYVFTSAFFFLIFFTFRNQEEVVSLNEQSPTAASLLQELENNRKELAESLPDSLSGKDSLRKLNKMAAIERDIALLKRDTTSKNKLTSIRNQPSLFLSTTGRDTLYTSLAIYDSIQQSLPAAERDNFVKKRFVRQSIRLKQKYHDDGKAVWGAIFEKFKHLFPQMLFVSLPLFALLLQLLYIRKKNIFYVNHVIFTIHLYCGTFIIILGGWGLLTLLGTAQFLHVAEEWATFLLVLSGFYFWYKSMRNFYEQGMGKTLLKYLLALFMGMIIMGFLFIIFFVFSAMAI